MITNWCVQCKKAEAAFARVRCLSCLKQNREQQAALRRAKPWLHREADKRLRQKRIRAGLCAKCGKQQPQSGLNCEQCKQKDAILQKQRHYKERINGICAWCGRKSGRSRIYCKRCAKRAEIRKQGLVKLRTDRGLCAKCGKVSATRVCEDCRKKAREYKQKEHAKIRAQTYAAYGNKCACCGESNPLFLTIDHVYNDGAKQRRSLTKHRKIGGQTLDFYRWLKRQGFPKDRYQLLCANCNMGKHRNSGKCPHLTG